MAQQQQKSIKADFNLAWLHKKHSSICIFSRFKTHSVVTGLPGHVMEVQMIKRWKARNIAHEPDFSTPGFQRKSTPHLVIDRYTRFACRCTWLSVDIPGLPVDIPGYRSIYRVYLSMYLVIGRYTWIFDARIVKQVDISGLPVDIPGFRCTECPVGRYIWHVNR